MKLLRKIPGNWLAGWALVFIALLFNGCLSEPAYTDPFATTPSQPLSKEAKSKEAKTSPDAVPAAPGPVVASAAGAAAGPAVASAANSDSTSSAGLASSAPSVKLRVGELVNITYSDIPTTGLPLMYEGRVKDDGTITIPPYSQTFVAVGKTTRELEQEIRVRYVPKYFLNLTVSIKTQDLYYSVDGEVRRPSRQPYVGQMTVLGAVASAEGFTDYANKKKVKVIRADGKNLTVNCIKALTNPTLDVAVFPGDKVIVPRRLF